MDVKPQQSTPIVNTSMVTNDHNKRYDDYSSMAYELSSRVVVRDKESGKTLDEIIAETVSLVDISDNRAVDRRALGCHDRDRHDDERQALSEQLSCLQSGDNCSYSVLDVVNRSSSERSYTPSFNSRQMHNQKERMRRSRMKSSCDALRRMVPGLTDKTDKATVLEQTVNFLLHLSTCSGVNCQDYIPEIPPSMSMSAMQYYQQYMPSKKMMIEYQSAQQAEPEQTIEMEEQMNQMENQIEMASIETIESNAEHEMTDDVLPERTARLVTTKDGLQYMIIEDSSLEESSEVDTSFQSLY